MDLKNLYKMQLELDQSIEEKHVLKEEPLFQKKVLALLVEIGELANETRCFKFWSMKPPSERDIILEEFVDGLHFILSLGLEAGHVLENLHVPENGELSVTAQFLNVYAAVEAFKKSEEKGDYMKLFSGYMLLAKLLGFESEEIVQAYIRKNEVNHERQQNDY